MTIAVKSVILNPMPRQLQKIDNPLDAFRKIASKDGEAPAIEPSTIVVPKFHVAHSRIVGDPTDRVREFLSSTSAIDRDQDTLDVDGWKGLDEFVKNGPFLWAHNRRADHTPIGKPTAAFVEGDGEARALKVRVQFPEQGFPHSLKNGFGHEVMRMYDEGLLRAVSVGFLPLEWKEPDPPREGWWPLDFTEQELLELSAVPVGSNRDAVHVARSKGIDTEGILAWAETVRDDTTGLWMPKDLIADFLDSAAEGKATVQMPAIGGRLLKRGSRNYGEDPDIGENECAIDGCEYDVYRLGMCDVHADEVIKAIEAPKPNGDKTAEPPAPNDASHVDDEPAADPEPDPEPDAATVYRAAMAAAVKAESVIVRQIIDGIAQLKANGQIISVPNKVTLRSAIESVTELVMPPAAQATSAISHPTQSPSAGNGDGTEPAAGGGASTPAGDLEPGITADELKERVTAEVDRVINECRGRLPD